MRVDFFGGSDSFKYELSRDADMSSGERLPQPLPLTVTSDQIPTHALLVIIAIDA